MSAVAELRKQWPTLTWHGRVALCWYAVRGVFIEPAADDDRCFMGAPISHDVWCPRRRTHGMWCRRHRESAR